jgi:hypothetical protein
MGKYCHALKEPVNKSQYVLSVQIWASGTRPPNRGEECVFSSVPVRLSCSKLACPFRTSPGTSTGIAHVAFPSEKDYCGRVYDPTRLAPLLNPFPPVPKLPRCYPAGLFSSLQPSRTDNLQRIGHSYLVASPIIPPVFALPKMIVIQL